MPLGTRGTANITMDANGAPPYDAAGGSADAERCAVSLGTAPIDNFITEFAPSIASRLHVRIVLVQRIINQVARSGNAEP